MSSSKIKLYQLDPHMNIGTTTVTLSQMMSYILRTDNDELIVIDGGTSGDSEYLLKRLRDLGGENPTVKAWFITHCHCDHVDAMTELLSREPAPITVEHIYHNIPSRECIAKFENGSSNETFDALTSVFAKLPERVSRLKTGDTFKFGGAVFEALFVPSYEYRSINGTTVVYRLEAAGQSVLFLGDTDLPSGKALAAAVEPEKLNCDFMQLAHHGQSGVSQEFYRKFPPKCALWCTPDWLWNNDAGEGFDTFVWETVKIRRLMKELGVKKHLVSKDGEYCITFPMDFSDDSWGKVEL